MESIRITEYATLDAALTAIENGQADVFGQRLNASDYELLSGYPNAKAQWAYDNLAFMVTMNTQFYPLENEHLRKAIAFAINKTAIAEDAMNGTVDKLDFVLPLFNEYSVEDTLGGQYYDAEILQAQDELALAGMLDVDDDSVVEAPNGDEVIFPIWYPYDINGLNETATIISEGLFDVGINNTLVPMNFTNLQYQIANHNSTYAIALYQQELDQYGYEWVATTFATANRFVFGDNIANINHAQLNQLADEYKDAIYMETAESKGYQAMMLIHDISPVVPLFSYRWLSVYSEVNFVNWPNDTYAGAFGPWTPALVTPAGSTSELVVAVLPSYFDDFFNSLNPFFGGKVIGPDWVERYYFNPYLLVYDSPIATAPDGKAVPRHATSWEMEFLGVVPDLTNNESRANYYCDPYANWTDGIGMDAQDYRFTFDYYKNNSLTVYSSNLDEVKVTGIYLAGVEYSIRDMFLYRKIGVLPILPEHIWTGKDASSWNPSVAEVVGSGPFVFASFTSGTELILQANADYYPEIDVNPPTLRSLTITPEDPIPSESAVFRVFVDDRSRIANVTLSYTYRVGTINFTDSTVMVEDASGYQGTIPARVTANSVYWEIHATDIWGNSAKLANGTYPNVEEPVDESFAIDPVLIASSGVGLVAIVGILLRKRRSK